ncbi:unnamed protein product, partial [Auanema sp. JU1783]
MTDYYSDDRCYPDETRLIMVDSRYIEFKVHLRLGYLAQVIDDQIETAIGCRHHFVESFSEMVEILKQLEKAAAPVIHVARFHDIKDELERWRLPNTSEGLEAYVTKAVQEFQAVLEDFAAQRGE